mmetsp:Transcript_3508/g.9334  ORF Transcript_3508/g.9334 Transcript_3508/m.9334 type:complete len:283 (-) Transcript_3508:5-853(-)
MHDAIVDHVGLQNGRARPHDDVARLLGRKSQKSARLRPADWNLAAHRDDARDYCVGQRSILGTSSRPVLRLELHGRDGGSHHDVITRHLFDDLEVARILQLRTLLVAELLEGIFVGGKNGERSGLVQRLARCLRNDLQHGWELLLQEPQDRGRFCVLRVVVARKAKNRPGWCSCSVHQCGGSCTRLPCVKVCGCLEGIAARDRDGCKESRRNQGTCMQSQFHLLITVVVVAVVAVVVVVAVVLIVIVIVSMDAFVVAVVVVEAESVQIQVWIMMLMLIRRLL